MIIFDDDFQCVINEYLTRKNELKKEVFNM